MKKKRILWMYSETVPMKKSKSMILEGESHVSIN